MMNESQRFYRRLREVFGVPRKPRTARGTTGSEPFTAGRDPRSLGDTLSQVTEDFGWTGSLAQHEVFARWAEIVGPDVAGHSEPITLSDGVLTVRCDSTAWATQLRMLRQSVLESLAEAVPAAQIESIRFLGPDAPAWKKGPRAVQGRGPRDTYG